MEKVSNRYYHYLTVNRKVRIPLIANEVGSTFFIDISLVIYQYKGTLINSRGSATRIFPFFQFVPHKKNWSTFTIHRFKQKILVGLLVFLLVIKYAAFFRLNCPCPHLN